MNNRLYKMMNWPLIEEITYSESKNPAKILGPHTKGSGTLVQCFFPGAVKVSVEFSKPVEENFLYELELADDDGFYAGFFPVKPLPPYVYLVYKAEEDGTVGKPKRVFDPYAFGSSVSSAEEKAFRQGKNITALLGAHTYRVDRFSGYRFVVYAPNAMRVSLVGSFNAWDGRQYQMEAVGDSGLFSLFVPDLKAGENYAFEIKKSTGEIFVKNDPFAAYVSENENGFVGVLSEEVIDSKPKKTEKITVIEPLLIAKMDLSAVKDGSTPAKMKEIGFSCIQLESPIFERSSATGDMVPASLLAFKKGITHADLKQFISACHKEGLSVISEINLSCFSKASDAFSEYDGTCIFEHQNPMQGYSYENDSCLYQFGSMLVQSLLNGAIDLLSDICGFDGLSVKDMGRMLYLDYGKSEGEWIPNCFGGNENLEAIEFLKTVTQRLKAKRPGFLLLAEDNSGNLSVCRPVAEGGLGFDYKWNVGLSGDLMNFMLCDPLYRGGQMDRLLNPVVYAFSDNFVNEPFTDSNLGTPEQFFAHLPGDDILKMAEIRLLCSYCYTLPGQKKLPITETYPEAFFKALNASYKECPALTRSDATEESFEWLSTMNRASGCLAFLRRTGDPEELLLVAMNTSGIAQDFAFGVPYEGKYKEIFNTDDTSFGGTGILNKKTQRACDTSMDGRTQSLKIHLGPCAASIISFIPYTESELEKVIMERIRKSTPVKKSVKKK